MEAGVCGGGICGLDVCVGGGVCGGASQEVAPCLVTHWFFFPQNVAFEPLSVASCALHEYRHFCLYAWEAWAQLGGETSRPADSLTGGH